jgi:hypothetical protein
MKQLYLFIFNARDFGQALLERSKGEIPENLWRRKRQVVKDHMVILAEYLLDGYPDRLKRY